VADRLERVAIGALALFIAVSAIGGSWGLLAGVVRFPLGWLVGTPFGDYTIPALILGVAVGGGALAAAALLIARDALAPLASVGAGLIQVGWIVGEVVLVGTSGDLMLFLQVLYLALGAVLAALAADLWLRTTQRAV
jgi:hypothetical protein